MPEQRRIIFSNECPNDQGGIIPNDTLDFSRYMVNPVILAEHNWDGGIGQPFHNVLGRAKDIMFINGNWTAIPEFHDLTAESKLAAKLYEQGYLKACSIGGEAIWRTTGKYVMDADGNKIPDFYLNENGLRVCSKFVVYEISLVALPSNPEAVTMASEKIYAKCYSPQDVKYVNENISKLNSLLQTKMLKPMSDEKENKEQLAAKQGEAEEKKKAEEAKAAEEAAFKAEQLKAKANKETLGSSDLPGVIKDIIGFATKALGLKAEAPDPIHKEPGGGDKGIEIPASSKGEDQPKPIGLKAKSEAIEKAKQEADEALEAAKMCKNNAEKAMKEADEALEAEKEEKKAAADKAKEAYEAAQKKAEASVDNVKKLEAEYEEDADEAAKQESEKSKNKSNMKPVKKTTEELAAEVAANKIKLAPKPEMHTKITSFSGKTLTQLRASLKEGKEEGKVLMRALSQDAATKDISDYVILGNSILNDDRFKAIAERVRFNFNVDPNRLQMYQANPNIRGGFTLKQVVERLQNGTSEFMNFKTGRMERMTTLGAGTDYVLANPDTLAVEWLTLAIFKLFPDNTWKSEIPIFGIAETTKNTGIIWTNIAADPTITKGTKPVTPADYTYSDTAVALKLVPYWLQPMLWEPLTMHQLRYDQMGTGWAQAFAKWDSVMDDDLLYVLASTVPAASMVDTSGTSFNIASTSDVNAFYWGTFTGNLARPVLNDIIRLEQLYKKQNFQLEQTKATVVLDSTAESFLSQDSEVKNKLTEWKNITGGTFLSFKNTVFHTRSRVAIYDPASGLVKDPTGVIPATAVSACVSFIPSQVGIGLGMLDVFMIQDPTNYGYRMSADIRKGIVPLRANYNGTGLLNYGATNI